MSKMFEDRDFRENFSKIVVDEIKKINEIIDSIGKIGKSIDLNKEILSFDVLIDDLIKEKGIEKKFEKSFSGKIEGDFLKLKEAIGYLMEFIKEDVKNTGKIVVNIEEKNGEGIIVLSEDGKNIDFNKEDVFIPFNSSLNTGLSVKILIAKKIIEAHNGTLDIEVYPSFKNFIIKIPLKNE